MSAPEARIAHLARREADRSHPGLAERTAQVRPSHSVDEATARHGRKASAAPRGRTR